MKLLNRREQEVWEACDLLWGQHSNEDNPSKNISGRRIMEKLVEMGYKRGNYNQIYQYRNSWLAERNLSSSDAPQETSRLDDKILAAVSAVHSAINQETEDQINSISEQCRRDVEEIASSKRKIEESYGSLKHEFLRLDAQFNDINEKYADLEKSYRNLNTCYNNILIEHKSLDREYETYKKDMLQKIDELQTIYRDSKLQHKEEVDRIILQNKLTWDAREQVYEQQRGDLKSELNTCLSQYEIKCEQFLQEKSKASALQETLKITSNLNNQYEENIEIIIEENNALRNELSEYKNHQNNRMKLLESELQIRDTKLAANERLLGTITRSSHIFEEHNGELLKQLQMLRSHNEYLELKIKRDISSKKVKKAVKVV